MASTKLSISVDSDLAGFVDRYRSQHGVSSKSEVIERALQLLRQQELREQYAEAYREWHDSGEAALWDNTLRDGLDPHETW